MKYAVVIIIFISFFSGDILAQKRRKMPVNKGARSTKTRLRHVEGIKFFEGFGGFTSNGFYGGGSLGLFFVNNMSIKGNVSYENSQVYDVKINRLAVDLQYGYTLYGMESIMFFSIHGGLTGVLDRASSAELLDVSERVSFGAVISPEIEVFILQNLSIFVRTNQRIMFTDNFGRYRNGTGAGFRMNFR